jgi:tetratricopeptide (TPR) repeat protein
MSLRNLLIASSLAITLPVWADTTEVLAQADALIRLQASDKAYEILAPLEEELAGNPNYDYLFGLALLEQNKPQLAIFAFERCLNVEPKNGFCRVQMARTHLALGEASNARAEFEIINDYNPPAEINDLVRGYLNAIQNLEKTQKRHLALYSQIGMGYAAASIWRQMKENHLASQELQVIPRLPLPVEQLDQTLDIDPPALVKGYLRVGAKVLGAPAWDPDFNTADLPMLMRMRNLPERYRKHFLG